LTSIASIGDVLYTDLPESGWLLLCRVGTARSPWERRSVVRGCVDARLPHPLPADDGAFSICSRQCCFCFPRSWAPVKFTEPRGYSPLLPVPLSFPSPWSGAAVPDPGCARVVGCVARPLGHGQNVPSLPHPDACGGFDSEDGRGDALDHLRPEGWWGYLLPITCTRRLHHRDCTT